MINWDGKLQTRDGRKASLLGKINREDGYAVVHEYENGEEYIRYHYKDGGVSRGVSKRITQKSNADIINVPERIERWVNVYYEDGIAMMGAVVEDSDAASNIRERDFDFAGLIKLTIEDGKLIDAEVVE